MKAKLLKNVRLGDYFRFIPSETATLYVRGEYDRYFKQYSVYKYHNVNSESYYNGTRIVYVEE